MPDQPNRYTTLGGDLYLELPGGGLWRLFDASRHAIRPDLDEATYCASCGGEERAEHRCWPWGRAEWCCRACNLMLDEERRRRGINRPPWELTRESIGRAWRMPAAARFHDLAHRLVRGRDDAAAQEMPAAATAYLAEVRAICGPGAHDDPRYQESWRHASALLAWITLLRRNDEPLSAAPSPLATSGKPYRGSEPGTWVPPEWGHPARVSRTSRSIDGAIRDEMAKLGEIKVESATLALHPVPVDPATLASLSRMAQAVISGPIHQLRPAPRLRHERLLLVGGPDGVV